MNKEKRTFQFWVLLVPILLLPWVAISQEIEKKGAGSFLDSVTTTDEGAASETAQEEPASPTPVPETGEEEPEVTPAEVETDLPELGTSQEPDVEFKISVADPGDQNATEPAQPVIRRLPRPTVVYDQNWTRSARGVLPGDNVTPPQGSASLVSELKAKFGISPRNGSARWNESQLRSAFRVLSSLPEAFRKCTKYIQRDGGQGGILGWVMLGNPTVHIESAAVSPGTFQGTLVHEMVHCFQAENNNILRMFQRTFWPNGRMSGRSVSRYGCTQMIEDMAECGRAYWAKGALMKKYYPGRYEFMRRYVFKGVEFLDPANPTGGTTGGTSTGGTSTPGTSGGGPGGTTTGGTSGGSTGVTGGGTTGGTPPAPTTPTPPPPSTPPTGTSGGQTIPTSGDLAFIDFPAQKNLSNSAWGPVLTDIENHLPSRYGTQYRDSDNGTHAHETTHGINSHLRNYFNKTGRKANGFYVGGSKGVIVIEPGIRKSACAEYVPESLRGDRYNLYIQGMSDWDDTPLYILDEWVSYTNGGLACVDQAKKGLWRSGWRDGVAGSLEFTVYSFALAMAVAEKDSQYFESYKQFKAFMGYQAMRAMMNYHEGSKIRTFAWQKQDAYFQRFKESSDAESLREFIKKNWGEDFWKAVIVGN